MGKQGPCCHCGVTSTPLWRNGPPEKPVLCNACGSRWRTKGTLMNYTPLHARQFVDPEESRAHRAPKVKTMSCKHNEQKAQKRKQPVVIQEIEHETPYCGQNFHKALGEDASNRSSSGSVVSCSESYAQVGNTDANDMTASEQSNAWDSLAPSHKRICIPCPKPSPVEKLRKDLYSILCEQQSSNISEISDGDLLYESTTQTGSVEIGHGGVLIRPPNLEVVEEESEASSFPLDNKSCSVNQAYARSVLYSAPTDCKGPSISSVVAVKIKKPTEGVAGEHVKRDKSSRRMLRVLRDRHSPLSCINLSDIISFEIFTRLLSSTEQEQLMKFLPPVDTAKAQMSLKSMFQSPQFLENIHCFQQLLLEGVFDLSFLGPKLEECKILKKHVLSDVKKARWLEQYKQLKDLKVKQNSGGNGFDIPEHINSIQVKGPNTKQGQNHAVLKETARSLKRKIRPTEMTLSSKTQLNSSGSASRLTHNTNALTDNEEGCLSPQSIFASPVDHSSMLASLQFTGDGPD